MKTRKPRILSFDLEISPTKGYTFQMWNTNIGKNQIVNEWFIMSFAAKWHGEDHIYYEDVSKQKDYENDLPLLKKLWKLIDKADIVIVHNGDRFDIKKMNTRFILNGLPPPSPYLTIDTLKTSKKYFGFSFNSLDYLSSVLQLKNQKSSHSQFVGFELWKECLNGNKKAWKEMKKYNIQDVLTLESLFEKFMVWDTKVNFLSYQASKGVMICSCGSKNIKMNGRRYTNSGYNQKYVCMSCGKNYTEKKNHNTPKIKPI